jgi:hypothetical protein
VTHLWGQERKASTVNFMGSFCGTLFDLQGLSFRATGAGW